MWWFILQSMLIVVSSVALGLLLGLLLGFLLWHRKPTATTYAAPAAVPASPAAVVADDAVSKED